MCGVYRETDFSYSKEEGQVCSEKGLAAWGRSAVVHLEVLKPELGARILGVHSGFRCLVEL